MKGPIPDSYWIQPGRLCAGEYPGAPTPDAARARLATILASGVTAFVDLTEEDEGLLSYSDLLPPGIEYARRPIRDLDCPTPQEMTGTLDAIDDLLERNQVPYIHCWGGIGRTGTVVGCWLIRHGATGPAALAAIASLRARTPDGGRRSPETDAQVAFVNRWPR